MRESVLGGAAPQVVSMSLLVLVLVLVFVLVQVVIVVVVEFTFHQSICFHSKLICVFIIFQTASSSSTFHNQDHT